MNVPASTSPAIRGEAGKSRLLSVRGDPFLCARWERPVFLHFAVEPELLQPHVRRPFQLELHDGRACVSLVAFTMNRFRPVRRTLLEAWPFALAKRQSFLNLRTYVRWGHEPGALFLWGWSSRPFLLPLPARIFGLPYSFASLRYEHWHETGELRGKVVSARVQRCFAYRASVDAHPQFALCPRETSEEFAMERYSGFFYRNCGASVFRAWHPPWRQVQIMAEIEDRGLIEMAFPWFKNAKLTGANYASGFNQVWLGKPHRIVNDRRHRRRVFFELP